MAWTQDDADRLERAIASGRKRVRFKDRETEYHSVKEMMTALASIRQEIAASAGASAPSSYTVFSTSKGFDRGCNE